MIRELDRSLGQILEMIYMDREGNLSQRRIRPLSIQGDSLKAYCYMRQEIRTFSIGNILAVSPARSSYAASTFPSFSARTTFLKM